jgi:predicted AAA+ superfamily ATPase
MSRYSSQFAADCFPQTDISHATARAWVSLLEAGYILFILPPWYRCSVK